MLALEWFAIALSLAQAAAPPPDAAPPPAANPVLTLDAALRRGAEASLDLRVARARLEQARAGIGKAWSLHLPQVTAGATYTRNSDASSITLVTGYLVRDVGAIQGPPAGQGIPGAPTSLVAVPSGAVTVDLQKVDQLGAGVEARQAILAPGVWFAIRAASQGADSAAMRAEAARRDVLFGVSQAYYGAAALRRLLDVSARLLEIARGHQRDAEARHRAGTVPKAGLVRAQVDRAVAEQDLRRSRNAYESAKISLGLLLDRDAAFEVVDPPEPSIPPDLEALPATALRERPDVKAARLAEQAAASLRKSTALRVLPAVGAFGRWQFSSVDGLAGRSDSWAVGLSLSWSILDGGLREADLRESGARAAEAQALRQAAEARAVAEVAQARLDLESARANAQKAQEQVELAAENQRLGEAAARAGTATAVEQADAAATYRNALVAAAAESLQAQLAALRLLQVAGVADPATRH